MHTHSTRTPDDLLTLIREQKQRIASLIWNDDLSMLNQAGLRDAIDQLAPDTYTVVFADINRLKTINAATGSHVQTNRYLRDGLRVRRGELAGQYLGDEFLFVLPDDADAQGFCARLTRQLAAQPLTQAERSALEALDGPHACLSATFAWETTGDIWAAVERLSREVLKRKAQPTPRMKQALGWCCSLPSYQAHPTLEELCAGAKARMCIAAGWFLRC